MTLHYTFDDIMCDVIDSPARHINNGWFEPHYHREECVVEFKYEVEPSFEDFFDFIKPHDFNGWKEEGRKAYKQACLDIWRNEWFTIGELEEDEDFIEFMEERYKDEAHTICVEENQD